jgi:hypothetical protein
MKNFSKLFFTALFMLAVAPAFSQFSVGLDLGLPNGSWSDGWGTGFGVTGRYEAPIQDKLSWTASAGFMSFSGKSVGGYSYPSLTMIPVTGGVKYYFQESGTGFYAAGDVGFWLASVAASSTLGTASSSKTYFGFAPGVGYRINQFDFTFRFNAVSDVSYMGLRAAYVFGGSK